MSRRPLVLVLLLVACASPSAVQERRPAESALPLRPAAGVAHADWLASWAARTTPSATLRRGEHRGEVQGAYYSRQPVLYPVFQATLGIRNDSGHPLTTGSSLYLVETAAPAGGATAKVPALEVIGGQFRESPAEDYAGVVEVRGSRLTPDAEFGLIDSIDVDARRGFFGGAIDMFLTAAGGSGGNQLDRRFGKASGFGTAAAGETLTVETDDLQFTVRVAPARRGSLFLIGPLLTFSDAAGARASFRYLFRFEDGHESPVESTLLPIDEESLLPMLKDTGLPLWRRTFMAGWAGSLPSPAVTTTLLDLAAGPAPPPRPVREAAIYALAGRAEALDRLAALAANKRESWQIRSAATWALGASKNPAAATALRGLLGESDNRVRGRAIDGLAALEARDSLPDLIALLSKRDAAEARSRLTNAIGALGDASTVEALAALGSRNKDLRRTLVPVMVKLGGPSAIPAVGSWFQASLPKGSKDDDWPIRMDICEALGALDDPRALELLRNGIRDPHDWVRGAAVRALAKPLTAERGVLLTGLMTDTNAQTARAAIRAAGLASVPAAKAKIIEIVKTPSLAKEIRWAALEALAGYRDRDALQTLLASLATETDANLRADTLSALAAHGTPEALTAIEQSLGDGSSYVTERAAWLWRKQHGIGACAATHAALLARTDSDGAEELAAMLMLPGCRSRAAFDALVSRLGTTNAAYDTEVARLLTSWTGAEAGTDKAKWTAAWR